MQRIKIDNTRKQITLKDTVVFGKPKVLKAKKLSEINYKKFDKDLTTYYNHKGHTYIFENIKEEQEVDEVMDIKSKIKVDEELKARYFAGLDEARKIEIQEIKEEYNFIK